jgi:anti-sigma factor RsiW
MGLFRRADDHQWSQLHLSHYADGDLSARARRRLERHAEDCVDCGRGIRAMRALLRLIPAIEGREIVRAPASSLASTVPARKSAAIVSSGSRSISISATSQKEDQGHAAHTSASASASG